MWRGWAVGNAIVCECGRLHDTAEPCPTCGADEELFDHVCGWCEGDARECACEGPDVCCGDPDDCEHFVCPWSDTCDGCFGELDGDGFCGSPGCEGSTSGEGA